MSKAELNKEMRTAMTRIRYIRSFTSHGETLSGSYLKDQTEIGKLSERVKEILTLLKKKA